MEGPEGGEAGPGGVEGRVAELQHREPAERDVPCGDTLLLLG